MHINTFFYKTAINFEQMVFLPEAIDYIGETKSQSVELAESLEGETISGYQDLARKEGIWLSLGGFHQKVQVFAFLQTDFKLFKIDL